MKNVMLLACASALAIFAAQSVNAQSLRNSNGPAERPPLSYKGTQFVDSNGCIFIRAGFGGSVTWVPRVNRSGKLMCGAQPSAVAGAEGVDPAGESATKETTVAARAPAKAPVAIPAMKPAMGLVKKPVVVAAVPKVVSAPKPAVRTVAAKRPTNGGFFNVLFGGNKRTTSAKTVTAPVRTVVATAKPASAPTVDNSAATAVFLNTNNHGVQNRVTASGGSCGNNPYMQNARGLAVRCAPQAYHPSTLSRVSGATSVTYLNTATAGHGTKQVFTQTPRAEAVMPAGYVAVWDDGRLNKRRGVGKLSGAISQSLVWTNTVPHRLIDRNNGKDVTLKYSYLEYPYTDYADQLAGLKGNVAVQEIVVVSAAAAATVKPQIRARTQRSTAKIATTATSKNGGYVQAGIFTDAAQAKRAIAALRAQGLPVKVGKTVRRGKPVQILITGPYAANTNLVPILAQVKRAGFPTAVIK